jgi:cytoskeletal protein CcmA (bactofilin family)
MKRSWARLSVLAAVLLLPATALAYGVQTGQTTTVPKGETKSGTFYATGQTVTVDGTIDGDLICAGQTVQVNGAVHGDVLCAGQTITVNGTVDGSVRLAGQTLNINGPVGRNVTVAGQVFSLGGGATVAGDLGVLTLSTYLSGPVAKTVYGATGSLTIDSKVGSVDAQVANSLSLGGSGQVDGNLTYASDNSYSIDKSKVGGQVQHNQVPAREHRMQPQNAGSMFANWLGWVLYWLAASLVTALALVWLLPRMVRRVNQELLKHPGRSLLWGLVVTILAPVVILLLMATIIGIPVGLLLGALWFLALVTSGLFAGVAVGDWITQRTGWQKGSLYAAAVVGIVATVIVFNIPLVGWLLALLATWWAVGGLVLSARPAQT